MFKEKLKELREQKGLSQYELADAIFVSRSTIAKWENGLGMPGKASMESLCEYFEVSKEELLKEEDPVIIIENIQKKSKKILILMILIAAILPIVLYCTAFLITYCVEMYEDTITPQDGKYYSEKYLRNFSLEGLEAIEGENYQLFQNQFCADIESYEVFEDYVKYVYNLLEYSTTISYLSIDKKIYNPRNKYADLYLIPSNNLSDHIDKVDNKGNPIEYEFYYLNDKIKRNDEEYINVNYLKLSYNGDKNFYMYLDRSVVNDDFSQKAYLINEYFDVEKIAIDGGNFEKYLIYHTSEDKTSINFGPYGTFIMSAINPTPVPPFHLFVKAKFSLYDGDNLIKEIEKYDLLTYGKTINVTNQEFGYDINEFVKYELVVDCEILENSYYYDIVEINK